VNSDRVTARHKRRTVAGRRLSPRIAIATACAVVAGGVGFGPPSGARADADPAGHHPPAPGVSYRPIADYLENNPQGVNVYGVTIGNSGSEATVLLNFGWNALHLFPTIDRTHVSDSYNPEVFGTEPFGYPGGFNDSILSETERPTRTKGYIRQTRLADGGVHIEIRARVTYGAVSIYDDEDIWGEGGRGGGGVGGCSTGGGSLGTGCNDLPGGSGEPPAVLGQDGDGRVDYTLTSDLTYTAEGVELAGGDLSAGINPTIPFLLSAGFGYAPGVTVDSHTEDGKVVGTVTDDAALAAKFGLNPGEKARFRYFSSFDEFVFDLIR
jgi:hypothetical protein